MIRGQVLLVLHSFVLLFQSVSGPTVARPRSLSVFGLGVGATGDASVAPGVVIRPLLTALIEAIIFIGHVSLLLSVTLDIVPLILNHYI